MSKIGKTIISLFMIAALCLLTLGCGGGGDDDAVATETPAEKIAQSVLVRPNKNEDFRYNIYTYYVEISECLSTKSNIVIPDTIQGYPVYKICAKAFANQTTFTSLTMTNNIIEIGANAFDGCTNLTSVTLSNNLEIMGGNAFSGCENLKEINIPGSLTEIPSGAFAGCSRLLSVKIEKSKPSSGSDENTTTVANRVMSGSFSNCPELRVVWIPDDVVEIASGEFNAAKENLTICGVEESAAAVFAAENLIDFKTETEFKEISSSALSTQKKSIGENVMSTTWKMGLTGVYVFGSDFKYNIKKIGSDKKEITETKTESVNSNENIVFLALTANNLSGSSQNLNILDFEVLVDGYARRISTYDIVGQILDASQNLINGSPLNGGVSAASAKTGCLAVRVPADWNTIDIVYKGDITLESTAFEISRDNIAVKWCNVAAAPAQTEPTTSAEKTETTTQASQTTTKTEQTTAVEAVSRLQ